MADATAQNPAAGGAAPAGARKKLTLVVPVYNENDCIRPFVEAVRAVALPVDREILFVDDGSSDASLDTVKDLAARDPSIRYLAFSRNFGKEAALLAGLEHADGDLIATMDIDLQDPPSLLPDMIRAVEEEGYDSAAARRSTRTGEPLVRSWLTRRFYGLIRRFSEIDLMDGARDYRLMTRPVAAAVVAMPEANRFIKGIYQWVGFRTKWLAYENIPRRTGRTKWPLGKLFVYSLNGILAFSTLPLQLASCLGGLACLTSFLALVLVVVRKLVCGDPVAGWASLVCVIIFFGGVQLFFTGVLGLYLAKIYRETKRRPLYIIRERSASSREAPQ